MKLHILLLAFGVTGDTDESRQLQGSPGGGYPGDDGLGGGYGDDEPSGGGYGDDAPSGGGQPGDQPSGQP